MLGVQIRSKHQIFAVLIKQHYMVRVDNTIPTTCSNNAHSAVLQLWRVSPAALQDLTDFELSKIFSVE